MNEAARSHGLTEAAGDGSIFEMFPAYHGKSPAGFTVDYLGVREDTAFTIGLCGQGQPQERVEKWVETQQPPINEEYFEWLDLLQQVHRADDSFTMLEFGAGYGRWGVRGIAAARQRGLKEIRVGFVEAEPVHIQFLRQHLGNNDVPESMVDIFEGVISEDPGETLFFVRQKVYDPLDTPQAWYGQAKVPAGMAPAGVAKNAYAGKDLLVFQNGTAAISVTQFSASSIVKRYETVDLIDLDVQGEEFVVIYAAIEALNRRAKRLHIGTHSRDIETNLRALMTANRWICLRDYQCGQTNETPFGPVTFQDGIQTWINPSLTKP